MEQRGKANKFAQQVSRRKLENKFMEDKICQERKQKNQK